MIEIVETVAGADLEQLDDEISALGVAGYLGVAASGDEARAMFNAHPSANDEQSVRGAMSSHVASVASQLRIYSFLPASLLDKRVPPSDVNYITEIDGRLHPTNSIVVDGEIRRVDYYASASGPDAYGNFSYSDIVVREDFAYTRDAVGFARARTQTITWFRNDGEPHPLTKTRQKFYEPQDSLREGVRRRGNITDKLAMDKAGWLIATQTQLANQQDRLNLGRDFMRFHKTSFDMFIEASSAQILYDVRDDVEAAHAVWIDDEIAPGVTIRDSFLEALNIWSLTL